ncbi:MAG: hypothetical protein Q7R95_00185 [bacterium]|nr:hypothetical protein [bacterium]
MKVTTIAVIVFILIAVGGGILLYRNNQNVIENSGRLSQKIDINTNNNQPTKIIPTANLISNGKIDESKNEISLTLQQPNDGQVTKNSNIIVKGITSALAEVAVNDKEVKADSNGNFSTTIQLDSGDNVIDILVTNDQGLASEKEIVVTYDDGSMY